MSAPQRDRLDVVLELLSWVLVAATIAALAYFVGEAFYDWNYYPVTFEGR